MQKTITNSNSQKGYAISLKSLVQSNFPFSFSPFLAFSLSSTNNKKHG